MAYCFFSIQKTSEIAASGDFLTILLVVFEKLTLILPKTSVLVTENSSVIRQKSESQKGGNKKIKLARFSEKQTFLTP